MSTACTPVPSPSRPAAMRTSHAGTMAPGSFPPRSPPASRGAHTTRASPLHPQGRQGCPFPLDHGKHRGPHLREYQPVNLIPLDVTSRGLSLPPLVYALTGLHYCVIGSPTHPQTSPKARRVTTPSAPCDTGALRFGPGAQAGQTVPCRPRPTQRDARRDQEKTTSNLGSISGRHSESVGRAFFADRRLLVRPCHKVFVGSTTTPTQ